MNVYKLLIYDGCNSNTLIIQAYDIIGAIQNSGYSTNQVISCTLIDSANVYDTTSNG